jgi:predicted membrane protein
MGLAAGLGAPMAGLIVAFGDFTVLSITGAAVAALMVASLRRVERAPRESPVGP